MRGEERRGKRKREEGKERSGDQSWSGLSWVPTCLPLPVISNILSSGSGGDSKS